jgi:hypothetical protein
MIYDCPYCGECVGLGVMEPHEDHCHEYWRKKAYPEMLLRTAISVTKSILKGMSDPTPKAKYVLENTGVKLNQSIEVTYELQ